jgi:uncharacterized protein YlxW (UPF0749 family)
VSEPTNRESGTNGVVRNPPPPLLETLFVDPLDPAYERAARVRKAGLGPSARVTNAWLFAGTIVVGLLLSVAFFSTKAESAGNEQVRVALIRDISAAEQRQSDLDSSAAALASEVQVARSAVVGAEPPALLAGQQMNALQAVSGPGLRISLDDPEAAGGNSSILDRDLQLLVNGLWSAGAEAVSVGGVRLRVTSPIRQAGGALLVDNRPVLWPMTIEAIGDPAALQQRFVSTTGYGRFSSFRQLYDITFDVLPVDVLNLPAAARVDVRYLSTSPTPTSSVPTR